MVSADNTLHDFSSAEDFATSYMAECRQLVLDELRHVVPSSPRFKPILYDLMLDYPLRAAKALRPALCIATCRALGGALGAVLPSAAVLELYHNAFLIHDDVEDGSEKRRDGATLHRTYGVPIALNVGDAMLALALGPLFDNMRLLGLGKALRILNAVAEMARHTAEGQALELSWIRDAIWQLDDRDYLRMVHKKTSWYTFITPVVVGALVAGATETQIRQLRWFATALGAAFQIQDDLLNLCAAEERYGKEINGDLWEGKRTLVLLHALRNAKPRDRARALAILGKARPGERASANVAMSEALRRLRRAGELSPIAYRTLTAHLADDGAGSVKTQADVAFLAQLVRRPGSLAHARSVASRRARRAKRSLQGMALTFMPPSPHREFLESLVGFVMVRDR